MGFPGGSEVKVSACNGRRPKFDPWVGKIPWSKKWQPTPVLLTEKSHGLRSLVGYSPWGRKESDVLKTATANLNFYRLLMCLLKQYRNPKAIKYKNFCIEIFATSTIKGK